MNRHLESSKSSFLKYPTLDHNEDLEQTSGSFLKKIFELQSIKGLVKLISDWLRRLSREDSGVLIEHNEELFFKRVKFKEKGGDLD